MQPAGFNHIEKFVKKPVEVEAIQHDGTYESATRILEWIWSYGHGAERRIQPDGEVCISISTLEGLMLGVTDDYIIKGVENEFYPCKPSVFNFSYTPKES